MITHCMGQGEVIIPVSSDVSIFDQSVVKMPVESFFDVSDIFYRRDSSNANLLALVAV